MKNNKVKPPSPRTLKYIANKARGLNKRESAEKAGYSQAVALHHTSRLEGTAQYQSASEQFALDFGDSLSSLTGKPALKALADEVAKIIIQSEDKSAKLKSIELALQHLGAIAPETPPPAFDKVLIVLK